MSLFKSITGVAQQALGKTKDFRKILDAAPGLSSFTFPPQVTLGLTIANKLGLGLPTTPEQAITRILGSTKSIDNILGTLKNTTEQVEGFLGQGIVKIGGIEQKADSVQKVLNSIEWLQ